MNTLHRLSRVFAAAALATVGSTGAFAQASWDLDACTGGTQRTTTGFLGCSGTGAPGGNAGGVTVSVKAYASNGGAAYGAASINDGGTYIGVLSGAETTGTGSPHHAIDNYTATGYGQELVHLQFSQAVDLSQIVAAWVYGGAGTGDFQVFRWDYNGGAAPAAITSYGPSAMTGWTSVTSADFASSLTQGVSDGTYYSSNWLISTKIGGSNDAFKLGTVASNSICLGTVGNSGTSCTNALTVPEPASLAMVLLAGLGAVVVRRRRV